MKRINLTENDILNIVNKVISEQKVNQPKEPLTIEQRRQRFLYGDDKPEVNVPRIKGETFNIKDKRGLRKEMIQFVVEDVEFVDTQTIEGTTALVKGYIEGQKGDKGQLTVFKYVCGRFGEFILKEYQGLDENDIKKQKTPKPKQDDSESSFKTNVKQGIGNFKTGVQDVKQGIEKGFDDAKGNIKKGFEKNKESFKKNLQGVKQKFQNDKGEI